jgi:HSP20 family protein
MPAARNRAPAALSELVLLQREVNQLIERLTRAEPAESAAAAGEWVPSVDVYDAGGQVHLVVEVPGLPPESLEVVCRNSSVVVSGERRAPRRDPGAGYLCLERLHGRFHRAIPIDVAVSFSDARARLADGLLHISLPKRQDRRGRSIEIPVERQEPGY